MDVPGRLTAPPQPRRFYDGGTDTEPPDPRHEPRIVLERVDGSTGADAATDSDVERWRMQRRLAYDDGVHGVFLVPAELGRFRTDLASVPALFTWLVPKTGAHLAPALVHDALVHDRDDPPPYLGAHIDRPAADAVFRRAMRDSGTGPVRAWLVWSAVTLGTIRDGSVSWTRREHLRYLLTAVLTLVAVAILGVIATLDLLDIVAWLPWMGGGRTLLTELTGGLAGAVVIPLVLGFTWGRFWIAGAITGIALAVLLHATVLLAGITALYQLLEWVARRRPLAAAAAAAVVLTASFLLTTLLVGDRMVGP